MEKNPTRLLDGEYKLLLHLLHEEYDSESTSDECKGLLLRHIANTPSVYQKYGVFRIKELTKRASNVLAHDTDSLDARLLERVYYFCREGILEIENGHYEDSERIRILEAHLYGYAGYFSEELYNTSDDTFVVDEYWLDLAYQHYTKAANMTRLTEQVYSRVNNGEARRVARRLAQISGKVEWALKVAND